MTQSSTHASWAKDMQRAYDAIPASWVVEYDGASYIQPERQGHPLTQLYKSLMLVGYAKGWV